MTAEKDVVIKSRSGLHARPAAMFVQLSNRYESEVTIVKDGQRVNGKSIMGILMLAAEKGSTITIIAEGDDAQEAVEELSKMLLADEEPISGSR